MWEKKYSKIFKEVPKEKIWNLWVDINNWPEWHGDLDYCKLDGPFEVGNHFYLKPKGVKQVKIDLIEVEKGRCFTDCTSFFGAKMYDKHQMEEVEGGLRLTNTLQVVGPLKWLWIKLVAANVAATVPEEMENLVKLAKANDEKK